MAETDEQNLTKRERQKARRAARLEREAQQAAAARRKRLVAYGVVVLVVLGAVGALVVNTLNQRRQEERLAEDVATRLEDLGCTPDERQPDLGGGHITATPESLAAEPPQVIYPERPPTSGRHVGQVAPTGTYDVHIDERITTHNLEHGYVIAWYDPEGPVDQVEAVKQWGEQQIAGDRPKTIVVPAYFDLPGDAVVSLTAWHFRQSCETFDPDVADVFAAAHYGAAGEAPEQGVPTHNVGAQGVIDPGGEDLLLPPLAEGLDEGADGEAPDAEGVPTDAPSPAAS